MTGPKNGGRSALGYRGGVAGSIRQQVHDGDTINVRAVGNFGVRFLGVDAPEISFALPGEKAFKGLADPEWQAYLANPFTTPFNPPLSLGLLGYLKTKVGPGVAMNHNCHAVAAEQALEMEVGKDLKELGQTEEDFRFFLAFAFEVMDGFSDSSTEISPKGHGPSRTTNDSSRLGWYAPTSYGPTSTLFASPCLSQRQCWDRERPRRLPTARVRYEMHVSGFASQGKRRSAFSTRQTP